MLIDLHASPGDLDPAAFADACAAAGLDAVVVADTARTDRLDAYLDALAAVDVIGFAGVRLVLDRGAIVAIPREDGDAFRGMRWSGPWSAENATERLSGFDGLIIAAHPYDKEANNGAPMGDRIYLLKKILGGVETRIGRGELRWDAMADRAADARRLLRVGSSSGNPAFLGAAATVVPGEVTDQKSLLEALKTRPSMVVELDDPAAPRDRRPPPREPRRERDDRGRPPRGRGGDRRGGRDGDRRGGRGGRGRREER